MKLPDRRFLYGVAVLIGGMVGVGIFGLPFAFAKAGYGVGMAMLGIVCAATLVIDLMYGEVILRTHAKHQLMGYTRKYLGPGFQRLVFFSVILTGYVGLLSYIIISGDFLNTLLSPFFYAPLTTYSILFTMVVGTLVFRGLKAVSWVELGFSGLFIAVIILIFGTGAHAIAPINFAGLNRHYVFLPYGVLLFAFSGLMAVPLQREILEGDERRFKKAIMTSVLVAAGLYALFTTTVVGVSGVVTSPDAISGLYQFLGERVTLLGSLFGIMAISTSFLLLGSGMSEMFRFDFHLSRRSAWLLTVVPPLMLFLLGVRTFVDIIGLAGGVSIGLEQVIVVFLYARAKSRGDRVPEYSLDLPMWLLYLLIAVFTIGIIYFLFIR